jgi:hypothetical protein
MAFDRNVAERTLVEVLDALNGNRVVGMGFRLLDGTIATACRCLPRPTGRVLLPDPSAPDRLVLVRIRKPATDRAAFAIVTAASPCSGLALLRSSTAAGLTVPDELNPIVPIEKLIAELEPASPGPTPPDGRVRILTHDGKCIVGVVAGSTIRTEEPLDDETAGAPVFDRDGKAVGLVTTGTGPGGAAGICELGEQLPGWALRAARDVSPCLTNAAPAAS